MAKTVERFVADHVLVDVRYERIVNTHGTQEIRYSISGNGIPLGSVGHVGDPYGRPWWYVDTHLPLSAAALGDVHFAYFRRFDAVRSLLQALVADRPDVKQALAQAGQ